MKFLPFVLLFLAGPSFADAEISRITTDFDHDGKPDFVVLTDRGSQEDEDALLLTVKFGNGQTIENPIFVRKVGQRQEAGVSLKLLANGTVVVSSLRDWGTSNWALDVFLSYRNGALKVSGLDYTWGYREKFGKCEFNLLTGSLKVNGRTAPYTRKDVNFTSSTSSESFVSDCINRTDK